MHLLMRDLEHDTYSNPHAYIYCLMCYLIVFIDLHNFICTIVYQIYPLSIPKCQSYFFITLSIYYTNN